MAGGLEEGAQATRKGFEPPIEHGSRGLFVSLSKGPENYVYVFNASYQESPPRVKE